MRVQSRPLRSAQLASTIIVWLGIVLVSGPKAWSVDTVCAINATVTDVQYVPGPPALPTQIKLTVSVSYVRNCDEEGVPNPPNPRLRVRLRDIDGDPVGASVEETFYANCQTRTIERDYTFDLVPQRMPKTYHVDGFDGGWNENIASDVIPEPVFACQAAPDDLAAYTTGVIGAISVDSFGFYKSTNTLYSVSMSAVCGVHSAGRPATCTLNEGRFGEAVNGEFKAYGSGVLYVTVVGTSPVVDMYASSAPGSAGWMVAPNHRNGTRVDSTQCIELVADQTYQFNVVTGRGDVNQTFKVTSDWYWWNPSTWILQRDRKELNLQIEPMRATTIIPLRPYRKYVTHIGGTGGRETELQIPMCGTARHPGNISKLFVMWPTGEGKPAADGFAKGWTIVGNTLKAPGPDGARYSFGE